jgi:2,3-bisphosphoglycerate-independent phosphoglycerate mutase
MTHHDLLARLAQPAQSRIVLLVLDGVGDLRTGAQPATALEAAVTPHLDRLAREGSLGRLVPVAQGVTPGSGPGHLGLFGYDSRLPEADIGRGVLEALGLGLEIRPGAVAVRGNFATADADGKLTDRRAGRMPTEESRRVCDKLRVALESFEELSIRIEPGESYRFVLVIEGADLSHRVEDTDPQRLGVAPLELTAAAPEAAATCERLSRAVEIMEAAIADEPAANRVLLRGFSRLPDLPSMGDLYGLKCGAFAGYPLYRGVAWSCGMEVVPCGKRIGEIVEEVAKQWGRFDYFFLHVKQTDQAGEDGDLAAKIRAIEEVDAALPRLLELAPDVLAVTADHSTPASMRSHSWHPVPLLMHGARCFADDCRAFHEAAAIQGHLGTLHSYELMGLLLAAAGRLAKYGA